MSIGVNIPKSTRNTAGPPLQTEESSYGLNPAYFLRDRKLWVVVGASFIGFALALMVHLVALSVSMSLTSQPMYWLTIGLAALSAALLHLVHPKLSVSGRQWTVARLSEGVTSWEWEFEGGAREVEALNDALDQQLPELRLTGSIDGVAREVLALRSVLNECTQEVTKYAATQSGRQQNEQRHSRIELVLTDAVGLPYSTARLWGPARIVLPMRGGLFRHEASMNRLNGRATLTLQSQARCLLSHELAHIMLREAPTDLFSDVRLLALVDTLIRLAVGVLVTTSLVLPVAVLQRLRGVSPPVISSEIARFGLPTLALITLAVMTLYVALGYPSGQTLWVSVLRWLKVNQQEAPPDTYGHTLARIVMFHTFAVTPLAFWLWANVEILNATHALTWSVLWVSLIVSTLVCRVGTSIGRQQMEYMADETVIQASAKATDTLSSQKEEVKEALSALAERLVLKGEVQAVPSFAAGHVGNVELSMLDMLARDDQAGAEAASRWPIPEGARRVVSLMIKYSLRIREKLWPLLSTHPTLGSRIDALQDSDRIVLNDHSAALFFAALPMLLMPHINVILSADPLIGPVAGLVSSIPSVGFLVVFALVARRPFGSVRHDDHGHGTQPLSSGAAWRDLLKASADRWLGRRTDLAAPAASANAQNTTCHPLGLRAELKSVTLTLLVAALAAHVLGTLVLSLARSQPTRDGTAATGALAALLDTSWTPLGWVIQLVTLSFSLYACFRATDLLYWGHLTGHSLVRKTFVIMTNVLLASVPAALGYGLATSVIDALQVLAEALLKPAWVEMFWRAFANNRPDGEQVFDYSLTTLTFGVAYASLVVLGPVTFGPPRCANGHPILQPVSDVLYQPTDSKGDWASHRCEKCGLSPQAPVRLRLRELRLTLRDVRVPNTSMPFIIAVGFLLATLLPLPRFMTRGLDMVRARANCTVLVDDPALRAAQCPFPRRGKPNPIPTPPKELEDLGGSMSGALMSPEDLPLTYAGTASRLRSSDLPSCEVGTRQGAAWTMFLARCAKAPPSFANDGPTDCTNGLEQDNPATSCACLWDAKPANALLAAARLYEVANGYLDSVAGSCAYSTGPFEESRAEWDKYLEQEITPRVMIGIARHGSPDAAMQSAYALPELPEDCRYPLKQYLRPDAADADQVRLPPAHCLTEQALTRVMYELDTSLQLTTARLNGGEDLSREMDQAAGTTDQVRTEARLAGVAQAIPTLQTLSDISVQVTKLRAHIDEHGFIAGDEDLCEAELNDHRARGTLDSEEELSAVLRDFACRSNKATNPFAACPDWSEGPRSSAGPDGDLIASLQTLKVKASCSYGRNVSAYSPDQGHQWMAMLACYNAGSTVDAEVTIAQLVRACDVVTEGLGDLVLDQPGPLGRACRTAGLDDERSCRDAFLVPDVCDEQGVREVLDTAREAVIDSSFLARLRVGDAEAANPGRAHMSYLTQAKVLRCEQSQLTARRSVDDMYAGVACLSLRSAVLRYAKDAKDGTVFRNEVLARSVGAFSTEHDPTFDLVGIKRRFVAEVNLRRASVAAVSGVCRRSHKANAYGITASLISMRREIERSTQQVVANLYNWLMKTGDTEYLLSSLPELSACDAVLENRSAFDACATIMDDLVVQPFITPDGRSSTLLDVYNTTAVEQCLVMGAEEAGVRTGALRSLGAVGFDGLTPSNLGAFAGGIGFDLRQCDWSSMNAAATRAYLNERQAQKVAAEGADSDATPEGDGGTKIAPPSAATPSAGAGADSAAPNATGSGAAKTSTGTTVAGDPTAAPTPPVEADDGRESVDDRDRMADGEIKQLMENVYRSMVRRKGAIPEFLNHWMSL